MRKRLWRILFAVSTVQVFFTSFAVQSEAKDLTKTLVDGFDYGDFGLDTGAAVKEIAPTFSAAVAQAVTQEFPLATVSPAFIYRHNPTIDAYERLTSISGPLFAERALTLGKGKFNLSVGYSYLDFEELNGKDLNDLRSPALVGELFDDEEEPVGQVPAKVNLGSNERLFSAPLSFSQLRARIDLKVHVIVPTLRYGITDNWEASLSIPIVKSSLRVSNNTVQVVDLDPSSARFLFARDESGEISQFFGVFDFAGNAVSREPLIKSLPRARQLPPLSSARGSATGVGDLLLRTKYQFWRCRLGGGTLGVNLQLPSGSKRNFHGTGKTHVFTFLYFSQIWGERFEPHLNVGVDIHTGNIDRSSFLYTLGGTLLVEKNLGVTVAFLGRSEFQKFPVRIRDSGFYETGVVLDRASDTCTTERPCGIARADVRFPFFPEKIRRNDILNFSFGLRYTLGVSGSIFFGGVVPLTTDGFRTDFIPSGGIEYTF